MGKRKDVKMKIANNVTDDGYIQWIEDFVLEVLRKSKLKCNEVIIKDIEWSKRIFLSVDDKEFDIRTWNFHPIDEDINGYVCSELVEYTLFEMVSDEHGMHGVTVCDDTAKIVWVNKKSSSDGMESKEEMLDLIIDEDMKNNNPNCIYDECNEDCPDIECCYAEAISKCNSEFAESIDFGGYDSEEEFWDNL